MYIIMTGRRASQPALHHDLWRHHPQGPLEAAGPEREYLGCELNHPFLHPFALNYAQRCLPLRDELFPKTRKQRPSYTRHSYIYTYI